MENSNTHVAKWQIAHVHRYIPYLGFLRTFSLPVGERVLLKVLSLDPVTRLLVQPLSDHGQLGQRLHGGSGLVVERLLRIVRAQGRDPGIDATISRLERDKYFGSVFSRLDNFLERLRK